MSLASVHNACQEIPMFPMAKFFTNVTDNVTGIKIKPYGLRREIILQALFITLEF
jgi:hypothetical protein